MWLFGGFFKSQILCWILLNQLKVIGGIYSNIIGDSETHENNPDFNSTQGKGSKKNPKKCGILPNPFGGGLFFMKKNKPIIFLGK